MMDTDSSYGGSETSQDMTTTANDNNTSIIIDSNNLQSTIKIQDVADNNDTIKNHPIAKHDEISTVYLNVEPSSDDKNQFYHKNEVTLPVVNYNDETDAEIKMNSPHYTSTAKLNINDDDEETNLENMSSTFKSTTKLHQPTPKAKKKQQKNVVNNDGVDNPAFEDESSMMNNGTPTTITANVPQTTAVTSVNTTNSTNIPTSTATATEPSTPKNGNVIRSSFGENKKINGDLNTLSYETPMKNDDQMPEAVNLELINLKPIGKDVVGPYENGKNGVTSIPTKKESEREMSNPCDEYFIPVNEHRKYMR